jgi:hypothetical protein
MRDRDLYAKLLGIEAPWFVRDVDARLDVGEVEIFNAVRARAVPGVGLDGHVGAAHRGDAGPCAGRALGRRGR